MHNNLVSRLSNAGEAALTAGFLVLWLGIWPVWWLLARRSGRPPGDAGSAAFGETSGYLFRNS